MPDPIIEFGRGDDPGASPAVPREFRIVHVADLGIAGDAPRGPLPLNPDDFAELLERSAPRVAFQVHAANTHLPRLDVELAFRRMSDFSPESLAGQIPCAARMLALRKMAFDVLSARGDAGSFTAAVERARRDDPALHWLTVPVSTQASAVPPDLPPPAPQSSRDGADPIDDLLAMVDLPGAPTGATSSQPSGSQLDRLFKQAAAQSAGLSGSAAASTRRALQDIEHALNGLLSTVLANSQLIRLEQAWRGLSFLIGRIDFRGPIRLSVLHAVHEELAPAIDHRICGPVDRGELAPPTLIHVDAAFSNTPLDVSTVATLAELASAIPSVLSHSLSPAFLGIETAGQFDRVPTLSDHLDRGAHAQWNSLRDKPAARYLAATFGRFLLRAPYAAAADDSGAAYRFVDPSPTPACIWANGGLALAYAAARSVAETGWPTRLSGPGHGLIEELPGCSTAGATSAADLLVSDDRLDEFARVGLNLLTGVKGRDRVVLWNATFVARSGPDARQVRDSLAYQFVACMLSQLLLGLSHDVASISSASAASALINDRLAACLDLAGSEAERAIRVAVQERPTHYDVRITIDLPTSVVPFARSLDLAVKFDRRPV